MKILVTLFLCLILFLHSSAQKNEIYNKWTIISLGGTEALVYNGELHQKEQIRYINIDDEINIERIKHKIAQNPGLLWLIIKPADSTISISTDYKKQVNQQLGSATILTIESLSSKEKELLVNFKKEYPDGF